MTKFQFCGVELHGEVDAEDLKRMREQYEQSLCALRVTMGLEQGKKQIDEPRIIFT